MQSTASPDPFGVWPAGGTELDAITVVDDHVEEAELWDVVDNRDGKIIDTLGRAEACDLCDGLNRMHAERHDGAHRRNKAA